MNRFRRLVSAQLFFAYAFIATSGVTMKFFVKNHLLNESHGWIGLILVLAACTHILLNSRSLLGYFRNWRLWALALPVLAVLVAVGMTAGGEQPGADPGFNPGSMMRKLTQARLVDLAPVFGHRPEEQLQALRAAGIAVSDPTQTLDQIAQANHRPAESLLGLIVQ